MKKMATVIMALVAQVVFASYALAEEVDMVIACSPGGDAGYNLQYNASLKTIRISTWHGIDNDSVHSQVYVKSRSSTAQKVVFETTFVRKSAYSDLLPTVISFNPKYLDSTESSLPVKIEVGVTSDSGQLSKQEFECTFYAAGVGPGA